MTGTTNIWKPGNTKSEVTSAIAHVGCPTTRRAKSIGSLLALPSKFWTVWTVRVGGPSNTQTIATKDFYCPLDGLDDERYIPKLPAAKSRRFQMISNDPRWELVPAQTAAGTRVATIQDVETMCSTFQKTCARLLRKLPGTYFNPPPRLATPLCRNGHNSEGLHANSEATPKP